MSIQYIIMEKQSHLNQSRERLEGTSTNYHTIEE
jgi:hypothetical protein